MNAVVTTPAEALRELMRDAANRETECQEYLQKAHFLLTPPLSNVLQVVREQIGMAGRSDYFVLCEVQEVTPRRRLILWEAKAPQLAPFQVSTANRLMPTRDLIEAENQLLYYYDEYRGSAQFLDRYEIQHADDVRLGGIVIGRDDNWVRPNPANPLPDREARQLASSAVRIRNEHFYRDKIRLLTWDHIASAMSPVYGSGA